MLLFYITLQLLRLFKIPRNFQVTLHSYEKVFRFKTSAVLLLVVFLVSSVLTAQQQRVPYKTRTTGGAIGWVR